MPFTCSLCKNKYCGKHRLPESHECEHIGIYDTDEYRRQKLIKTREIRAITVDSFQGASAPSYRGIGGGDYWTSGNKNHDAIYGGGILGLSALISGFGFYVNQPLSAIIVMVLGGLIMFGIYKIREYVAHSEGMTTSFQIWPIGVAITLITSLFFLRFLLFGFFVNGDRNLKSESKVGVVSTISLITVGLAGTLGVQFLELPSTISNPIRDISFMFVWLAIFFILPFGDFDGAKIFNYDRGTYWILLAIVIISFLVILTN